LWLLIARHITKSVSLANLNSSQLLEESELLSIEDILPLFSEYTAISSFKQAICSILDTYHCCVGSLRSEANELAASATKIGVETGSSTSLFSIILDHHPLCQLSGRRIKATSFYAFSSGFCYCVNHLQNVIMLETEYRTALCQHPVQVSAMDSGFEHHEVVPYTKVAAECPLTGIRMIRTINRPLCATNAIELACT